MAHSTVLVDSPIHDKAASLPRLKPVKDASATLSSIASSSATSFRYTPLRSFKMELLKNEAKIESAAIMCCLFVIAAVCYITSLSSELGFWINALLAILVLIVAPIECYKLRRKCLDRAGHVHIDKYGLGLPLPECQQYKGEIMILPWADLISVNMGTKSKKHKAESDSLVFRFNSTSWKESLTRSLQSWGKGTINEQEIVLDMQGFASRDNKRIKAAVLRFAPPSSIDKAYATNTIESAHCSYTSLWLKSLQSTTRRANFSRLAEGTFLNDYRYEVVKQIASGGQACTYEAIDHFAKFDFDAPSQVVLKELVIPVHSSQKVILEMFEDIETVANILDCVSSKHIVKLYDRFLEDSRIYLVLEYVEGQTLRDIVLEHGPLSQGQVVELAMQMCEMLQSLHENFNPIVHRDFAPDNLILNSSGFLKLIDFDVAISQNASNVATVVGKPSFIAPEQFRGQACSQSDIFSLGATLFFLLTGKEPTPISKSNPALIATEVSQRLDEIVAKATSLSLDERYVSAKEILAELIELKELAQCD